VNEDGMQQLDAFAGDELERQLARYARVRLDPSPAATRRARSAVLGQAWQRRLEGQPATDRARSGRPGLFAAWSPRRLGASVAAALLAGLLVGSSVFAASRAGGPLYEARLTLETMTLPSDPDARLEAELAQAQSRIAEAVEAAARNDQGALAAALSAYGRSLDDLAATTGGPADRALQAVEFHRTVLLRLADTVPARALGGISNALDHSLGAIDKLDAAVSNNRNPNGAGNGNGVDNGNGNGPAATPRADASKAPPAHTPDPAASPKPGKTPKPAASGVPPAPPGQQP
jgi:hypothetical protein